MPIAAVSWGSGGFTVQQAGSLSLANVAVAGEITVQGGGSLSVSGGACKIGTLATLEGSRLSIYGLILNGVKNKLVISNDAAGTYTAAIAGSLGISTDLVIEAGQHVSIGGDGESEAAVSLSINHCCWWWLAIKCGSRWSRASNVLVKARQARPSTLSPNSGTSK